MFDFKNLVSFFCNSESTKGINKLPQSPTLMLTNMSFNTMLLTILRWFMVLLSLVGVTGTNDCLAKCLPALIKYMLERSEM